ncbi:cell division protein SepF [Mycoplasma feriruminatoris]|uniref:Cell division protein SepF n=2 Tax=Mycoplasma feriruminatoris TaxID=1179777 RepID=A0A654IN78_9MOLU|nr:cell division protein SepF [Mycoplasma feriruminatoris]WFQ90093.1 Cell division protein SepF [Mycoplasma feriruminatoris]WFQ90915.1 cell division protein SepF [Mycoplasma feriruminatoris]WFQ91736.1 Cell division protein SepF [Mycoplasma feriruminatoris]WFQ92560.1 Cell division protein SepF [Mycoplasma feriruminatoris]WFQ93427.1 cell division protein SepF [Mycoplasma feriruminatoris]
MFFKKKKNFFKHDEQDHDQIELELTDSDIFEQESPILKDSYTQTTNQFNQNHQSNTSNNQNTSNMNHSDMNKSPINTYVFSPMKFSEVQSIVDTLLEHKVVVVDFKNLDDNKAKRFKDFLSGVLYVKKGEYIRLNENIYKFIIN